MQTIVIDEDMPRSTAAALNAIGFGVLDIRDCGLRGESDERVFRFAQEKRAILMTGDLGFANMLRHPLGSHHGIIVARFPSEMPSHTINEHVAKALRNLSPADIQGNVIILEAGRMRIRRMK